MESESGGFEAQTTPVSRAEENEWSEENMRDLRFDYEAVEAEIKQDRDDYENRKLMLKVEAEELKLRMIQRELERRTIQRELELRTIEREEDAEKKNATMQQLIADDQHRLDELMNELRAHFYSL